MRFNTHLSKISRYVWFFSHVCMYEAFPQFACRCDPIVIQVSSCVRKRSKLANIGRGALLIQVCRILCLTLCLTFYWLPSSSGRLSDHMHNRLIKLQGWNPLIVLTRKAQKTYNIISLPRPLLYPVYACAFRAFVIVWVCDSSRVPIGRGVFTGSPCWC